MSTSPQRQSARRRLTRNAGEKSDDTRVSNEKNLSKVAGNVAPRVDGNLSQAEGKFAELEQFLKKTTKMLQVQLELVDIKYGKDVEGLKKKLEESIQEQATVFYTELLNLKEKTGNVEESLLKLRDSEVLTRDKVLGIVNNVIENRVNEGDGKVLSLDDVRAVARRLVEAEIERHAADGLGRVDYALGSGGGRVVQHSEGYFPGNGKRLGFLSLNLFRKSVGGMHPYAARVLDPSFGEPGHCLPLKGSRVFVVIALRTAVFAEAVTLEHVAKSNAYDRSSAPKHFRIFGWLRRLEGMSEEALQMFLLGEFTYDLKKSNAQTFNLPIETTGKLVNMIKLDVQSNHGSSSHTCIYRLRVHGKEPDVPRLAEIDA
ncbi:SUN domain-containing protein 1-like isoform X2 [Cryptomeria japonica]|uniref:SUN domain-containing protein 1-like isoform X2 n=1 Tax=Cryptomeria japonica TaxID=3369 RepID=UPI0027D9F343|nr:SUN domain-containing protein 1-like isoform X2 [Cryptomeria japonica]